MQNKIANSSDIKLGVTRVKVYRTSIDEATGKEATEVVHVGVVLQKTNCFLRVFSPKGANKERLGDPTPEGAQWYPMNGRLAWCEVMEKEEEPAMVIPPLFK